MGKIAFAVPVLPGKDAKSVSEIFRNRGDEYSESRKRQGVTMERAFEQVTPMGTFVVAYLESDGPTDEAMAKLGSSDLPIDREFTAALKDVHGMDVTAPPPGDPPEILGDFVDHGASDRKRGFAFSAPVMPGAEDRGREFAREAFETRRDEHAASRRALGVTQETVVLNHTPMGDIICVYIEGDDPDGGNRRFAESRSEYDVWFKEQLKGIFPPQIDFNEPVPGVTQIFDSQEALVAH
jgi:hypothetical protein